MLISIYQLILRTLIWFIPMNRRNNDMKATKILGSIGIITTATLALVACGKNNNANTTKKRFSRCNTQEGF